MVVSAFRDFGKDTRRTVVAGETFPDPNDVVFYEIKMSMDDAFLVTGNVRHFPVKPFVVTPAEMVKFLEQKGLL